ncbi:hypothetical protein SAMN05216532_0422 [Streptomyces sp. 2231.1]|uniref:hypothetical protein n=1 Tax=Streptomyces sp. 2231.1 TaxID=1855347 RepID=UPI000895DEFB|nr:hypothetical protein [Streptomyces sp. 2231.1]SEC08516.1 hypothetical protein SAMN05216532_0422 [Streptomyces sp. 2231.1]
MNERFVRRLTGIAGIVTAVALIVEVPLYFVYSGPPPDANVLTRLLIGIVGITSLAVFVTSFRELVRLARPDYEWAGSMASAIGLVYTAIALVSTGLEAGAVIAADRPIDPTITVSGTYILYGTISRLLLALFLAALGHVVCRADLLPRWVGRSAYLLAGVNLAFVPSLFFGNTPAHFYAANGWGTTALMGALLSYWLLAAGISTYRSSTRHEVPAGS